MDGRAVTTSVGMDTLGGQSRSCCPCSFGVLPHQVADTETSHGFTSMVTEDWFGVFSRRTRDVQQSLDSSNRFGPQWTEPFLSAFAAQANESGAIQLQVGSPYIQEFLDAGARVEQGQQQRSITDMIRPLGGDAFEHGGDFITFQIINGT
jgi:hypothetical protein